MRRGVLPAPARRATIRVVKRISRLHECTQLILLVTAAPSTAAHLTRPAECAFDTYIPDVEARLAKDHTICPGDLPCVVAVNGGSWPVPGGRLHHWRAAALVPGATAKHMLALLTDHDHLARYYGPEVVSSRTLRNDGETATIAMRFQKHEFITVVLDAEFETRSALIEGGRRGFSISRSTHIWQVDRPGSPQERRRPEGDDDGFLWRLNSYWNFKETPEGLRIECEAVSLTRDVPAGLGWLIAPIIQTLPRESLELTLSATRKALTTRRSDHDRAN